MQSILVCDDDCKVLESIRWQLEQCCLDDVITIKTFKNTEELLFFLDANSEEPYILLMDIRFEGAEDGITTVKRISQINKKAIIIFISAYDDYYEDVYEIEHVYFLKKPFDIKRLKNALTLAIKKTEEHRKNFVIISKKGEVLKVEQGKILYMENKARKVSIHTDEEIYSCNKKLEELEREVGESFVRCHQSYVINLHKVQGLRKNSFLMKNSEEIPISRVYYKIAKERFFESLER